MIALLRHLKSNVIAYLALFLALSMGTAWALEKNSVKSKNIVDGQVKAKDLGEDSVKSKNIVDGQVKAEDLPPFTLTNFELTNEESPSDSADEKTVFTECPGDKVAASGFFFIDGAEGFVAVSESRQVSPPLVPASGWRVKAIEVNGGTAEPWQLTAVAQCAKVS